MAARMAFQLGDEERVMVDAHPEINWSEVFRQAIREKVELLELAQQFKEEQEPRVRAVGELLKKRTGERWRRALGARGKSRSRPHARRR